MLGDRSTLVESWRSCCLDGSLGLPFHTETTVGYISPPEYGSPDTIAMVKFQL